MKYRGFISYSQKDKAFATWLHQRIESFSVPKELRASFGKKLSPIFRDRDEMAASSDIGAALRSALDKSESLIVILSQNALSSRWVDEEISYFRKNGPARPVVFIHVPKVQNAEINPTDFAAMAEYSTEPMYADARKLGDGKHRAAIKVIAAVLGVGFDAVYKRETRKRNVRRAVFATGAVSATALLVVGGALIQEARVAEAIERARAENERLLAPETDKLGAAATAMEEGYVAESYRILRTIDYQILRNQTSITNAHAAIFSILMHDPLISSFEFEDTAEFAFDFNMRTTPETVQFYTRKWISSYNSKTGERNWRMKQPDTPLVIIPGQDDDLFGATPNGFSVIQDGRSRFSAHYPWRGRQPTSFKALNEEDMYLAKFQGDLWLVNPPANSRGLQRTGWKTFDRKGANAISYAYEPNSDRLYVSARVGPTGGERSVVIGSDVVFSPDEDEKARIALESSDDSLGSVRTMYSPEQGAVFAATRSGGFLINPVSGADKITNYQTQETVTGFPQYDFLRDNQVFMRGMFEGEAAPWFGGVFLAHGDAPELAVRFSNGVSDKKLNAFLDTPLVAASVYDGTDVVIDLTLSGGFGALRGFLDLVDRDASVSGIPDSRFEFVLADQNGSAFRLHALYGRGGSMIHGSPLASAHERIGEIVSADQFDAKQHLADGAISNFGEGSIWGCSYTDTGNISFSTTKIDHSNEGQFTTYKTIDGELSPVNGGYQIVSAEKDRNWPEGQYPKRTPSRRVTTTDGIVSASLEIEEALGTFELLNSKIERPLFRLSDIMPDIITCADYNWANRKLLLGTTYHLFEFPLPEGDAADWVDQLENRVKSFNLQ